jgi:alpha-L-arabinofuranosidase
MTVLVVNRSRSDAAPVRIGFAGFEPTETLECWTVAEDDPRLTNSAGAPERVVPRPNSTPTVVGTSVVSLEVPPVSWTLLSLTGRVLDVFANAGD